MAVVEPPLSVRAEEAIFPQELVDYTIDFLHDDYKSLKGCTLVSHTWLPRSRLHLFSHRDIIVRTPDLDNFLEWARSCEFGPQYVRRVALFGGSDAYISIRKAPLVDLLTCLPHIESLIFIFARFESDDIDASASKELQRARRSDPAMRGFALKSLVVSESCDTDSRYFNLATCLGIFKSIKSLYIGSMENLGVQAMTLLARSLPPIDNFNIPNDTSIPLVRIYALTSTPQCIQSLNIRIILHGCAPYKIGMVLKHVGGRLRRLTLDLSELAEPRDIALPCAQLSLSACTRLEHVLIYALRAPSRKGLSCQSVAHLIGSIPRTTVQTISLFLWVSRDAATTTLDRDTLDGVLARFSALRELQVDVFCSSKIDSEVGKIWKAWPLTARKANVIVTIKSRWPVA